MNILYVSCLCSQEYLTRLINKSINKNQIGGLAGIKYHRLVAEGLNENSHKVSTISSLPISRRAFKDYFWKSRKENINGINYYYCFFINLPILRQLMQMLDGVINFIKWARKNKNGVIVCNVLSISLSLGIMLSNKFFKRKSIGVITDVPEHLSGNNNLLSFIRNLYINSFDSYIFISESMNTLINKKNKPYLIIEGISELSKVTSNNGNYCSTYKKNENHTEINDIFNVVYIGQMKKSYGVDRLLDAFSYINNSSLTLSLYGSGELVDDIINSYCKKDDRIKYFGVIPNSQVLKIEESASLLINPRPINAEFTKYSFPSKIIEYMSSGTPVLTTRLAGIPEEYDDKLYYIDGDSPKQIASSIIELYNLPRKIRLIKGQKALEFVIGNKNKISVAKKINDLLVLNEKSL